MPSNTLAHAEHDKPRYVSTTGEDQGECDVITKPCLTIGYAASMSNKGDIVKVEQGAYQFNNVSEVFYLTNDLVKIRGGYAKGGLNNKPNAKAHPTYVSGVPNEFHAALKQKGFEPVQDTKALSTKERKVLNQKLAAVKSLSQRQTNVSCVNGMADVFPCNNIDLVSHIPLTEMSSNPESGNDIWGHVDLNSGKEYAIIGVNTGTHVFDISNPSNPIELGFVAGQNTTWRDIKTYQFFSTETKSWHAYAYVSTDGANEGVTIINLTHLPTVSLVDKDLDNSSQHNIYISNVDYSTGVTLNDYVARLHILGSNKFGGGHRSYDLSNPEELVAAYTPFDNTAADYSHDGSSMMVEDSRAQTQCNEAEGFCDVFLDFNENEIRLWNQTVPANTSELGSASYNNAQYVHSGWWSEDKKTVFVHDELDEVRNNHNTHLYLFDVSDLTAPQQIGTWVGPTESIDHNGYVRGNRYYMSNYERGVTVLDITNPGAPVEVGHFDTFPTSDSSRFNGTWGVYPFLPSGLILASDINSGLYILKDDTLDNVHGSVEFEQTQININEGQPATFIVNRVGGIDGQRGPISVDFETLHQSASAQDYTSTKGTLTWDAEDVSPKEISVQSTLDTDDAEVSEQFGIRLINVQGGATLGTKRAATAILPGGPNYGLVQFEPDQIDIYEGKGFTDGTLTLNIEVTRNFGSNGTLETSVIIDDSTDDEVRNDVQLEPKRLTWQDGEKGSRFVTLQIFDNDTAESVETLVLSLTDFVPAEASQNSTLNVRIFDDESNQTPNVQLRTINLEFGSQIPLQNLATISDDTEQLYYLWEIDNQGLNITITNPDTLNATLNANASGEFELSLTVTDEFGQSATDTSTISVGQTAAINDDMPTPPVSSKSSSVPILLIACGLALMAFRRRKID